MKQSELVPMTKEEAKTRLKIIHEFLNDCDTSLGKINKKLMYLKELLDIEESLVNDSLDTEITANRIQELTENAFFSVRLLAIELCNLTGNPAFVLQSDDPLSEAEKFYQSAILPADQVQAFLQKDAIYVRLPMLWSRFHRKIRGEKGRIIGPDRFTASHDSIHYAIISALNYDVYAFAKYKNKIIHFLYVYHTVSSSKIYLVDNDNHESKQVTDAIAEFLPGGDTPLTCNFYLSAVQTKDIPEGTYITVTPLENGLKSEQDIIEFWVKNNQPAVLT